MMDDDAGWSLTGDGHLEGPGDELGVLVGRHGPADDLPRADVEDDGKEEEAGPGRDIGDVGHPATIGSRGGEVPLQEVGRRPGPVVTSSGPAELPPGHALKVGFAHEPSHLVAPHRFVLFVDQLARDPAIAIGLA
jgi:hypothetical protein